MTAQPVVRQGMNPQNSTPAQVQAIKTLQKFLGLTQDGNYGPKTKAAVMAYQKAHGLKDDGVVGEKTWATIPTNPIAQGGATPQQAAIATSNAANTAASTIKQAAVNKAAAAKPAPVKQVVQRPVTVKSVINNPAQAATQAATAAANAAQKAVTGTVKKVQQTHVVIKKQPLWLQIVTFAAAGLGAVAGYKALSLKSKRAA